MSTFAAGLRGALGGLGAGASQLANKYIDEELAAQRAQLLADIQRTSSVQQAKDIDAYTNDPSRRERLRAEEAKDLDARSAATLRGRVNEETNPDLRQARVDNEVSFLNGTTDARIAAQNKVTEGTAGTQLDQERMRRKVLDPMDVDKARDVSRAHADEQIRVNEATQASMQRRQEALKTAFDKLPEDKKLEVQQVAAELKDINKAIVEAQAGGTWTPDKNPGQKQLATRKLALEQRSNNILHGSAGDDPFGLFSKPPSAKAPPPPAAAPAPSAPSAPAPSLMDQARKRQPAPEGSPQAAWDARQEQLRRTEAERGAKAEAERKRAQKEFDADLSQMQPLEFLRKYDTPTARGRLDASRLARLKKLETTIR